MIYRLLTDQTATRLPRLMRYADRSSMKHSLETRLPFCNPNLSSIMSSLPEDYLIGKFTPKILFIEAMKGIILILF